MKNGNEEIWTSRKRRNDIKEVINVMFGMDFLCM